MRRRSEGQPTRRRRDRVHDVEVASIVAGPDDGDAATRGGAPVLDVVLVHGLGVSNRYLVPSLRAFARDHRVFAPDLPGVGRSSKPSRDLSMVELADGLRDWMDVVGVGPAVLVGHSLGCQVVAQLAARHPERVLGVVLTCPAPDPGRGSALEQGWRLLRDGFRERPAMALIAATDYPRVGVGGMLRGLRAAARRRDQPNLQAVDQPTLLIHGGRDPLVSASWVEALAGRFPDASVVTLPDAPHGVPLSAVEPFVATVHAFVDEVGRAQRPV
ncbi:alpha/beta fold hydrolase [Microlunatus antarcticus]|uniref:Pimeloyl-ACP methyl ester carboxylesterase n=1 Tax=Microlunatus antarcticus TaxID=53388 RepID=A0A7W5JXE0_9ACTN|nr:pimeloyl-ACP methyl ester carboxylesterase [Microlunatus antarcticus]